MNLNKSISTPIAILLIIVAAVVVGVLVWQFTIPAEQPTSKQASDYNNQSACQEADYYWYNNSCHKVKQVKTDNWKEPVEKVVREYGKALKTRERDKVLPYTIGELKKEWQKESPVFGTSNPHPDGCEILSSEKEDDNKFEIEARCFEAYTGEGRIGYSDNTYTVKKVQEKYLIGDREIGEYVEITEKEEYSKPHVITLSSPETIDANSVTLKGKLLDAGGVDVDDVSWEFECGKSSGTYTEKIKYRSGSKGGEIPAVYSRVIADLDISSTYYCRAKACNSAGCGYGKEVSFQTGSYYEKKGGRINKTEKIVTVDDKKISITDDAEMYCFSDLRKCSLDEICREKEVCGPYRFALKTQYYLEEGDYYAHKLFYTPQ